MNRYEARVNLHGNTQRERVLDRAKNTITSKVQKSLSLKDVKINGNNSQLVINSGTEPYYKNFTTLPNQDIKAGDYVEWADNIWLVLTADNDNELYVDGKLRQCNYKMYWQNDEGKILSRWCWVQNASAYNNGEDGNKVIMLRSNQFMVYMPYDSDTLLLENGKRMHMSKSSHYCNAYRLTRPDDLTFGYGEKGVLNMIFTQDEFIETKDKLIELNDGTSVWICDYIHSNLNSITSAIAGDNILRIGCPNTYEVIFYDIEKQEIDIDNVDITWNIECSFKDEIQYEITDRTIELIIENDDYIGQVIKLQSFCDSKLSSELFITVSDIW